MKSMHFTKKRIALAAVAFAVIALGVVAYMTPFFDGIKNVAEASDCNPKNDLSGEVLAGGKANITNHSATCSYKVGLASYKMFNADIDANNSQEIVDSRVTTISPNKTISLTVKLPSCASQIDLFYGDLITKFNGTSYGERRIDSRTNRDGLPFCSIPVPALEVTCTPADSTVVLGKTSTFTANPKGGTGSYSYSWVFNGDVFSNSKTASKIFQSVGSKTATVTVTSGGKTATAQCHVTVKNVPPPPPKDVSVTCTPANSNITLGQTSNFSASASGGNGTFAYSWVFNGDVISLGKTASKQFESTGSKTVTVTATSNGKSATAQCHVNVTSVPVNLNVACVASDDSVKVGDSVTFTANPTGGNGSYSYSWTFDGANISNSKSFSKSFTSTGEKTVHVTVTSNGQTATDDCHVNVTQVENNDLGGSCEASDANIQKGDSVTFTANPTGGTGSYTYSWSGTDGLSSNSKSVSKTYNSTGTKNATVVITSGNHSITRDCSTNVEEENVDTLDVTCEASDSDIDEGDSVTWSADATGGNGGYTYDWSGSDNLSSSNRTVTKRYNDSGTKTAHVTVTSNDGQTKTAQCEIDVHNQNDNNDNLDVSCDANESTVDTDEDVKFTAKAHGGGGHYEYDWTGPEDIDGQDSKSFTVSFNHTGTKTAKVRVTSDNGDEETARCSVRVRDNNDHGGTTVVSNDVPPETQASYVYLSQVPYTGIGSTAKLIFFILALLAWSAFVAYMIIRKRARKASLAAAALKAKIAASEAPKKPAMNPAAAVVWNRINKTA